MARILVVDDEKIQRLALTTMLAKAGHEALEADGATPALDLCRDGPIDVVITDLQMPGMHGLEFITLLRELDERPTIIAVSGTGPDQLSVAESLGADATLVKPVFADRLLGVVDEALTEGGGKPTFVVSDPPHRHIDLDAASALIGLDTFQTRLKFNFPAPEVLAVSDGRRASQVAARFREAGVRLGLIAGEEIAAMPWPNPVELFAFTESGLTATLPDGAVNLPYDTPGTAVYASLPKDMRPKGRSRASKTRIAPDLLANPGPGLVDAMERLGSLDLYYVKDDVLHRLSIVERVTDFAGLGDLRRETAAENLEATLVECQRRFGRVHFDTRLEKLRPRRRFEPGDMEGSVQRRRYSFGTAHLREVLESVSVDLGRLTQFELGSRLGYLTSRERPVSWKV